LQNNSIKVIPEDFFPACPNLTWLDLRDNDIESIPISIKNHPQLTHLLLQNNKIISMPNELGTVMTLKVLQLSGNPLTYPPKDIISAGTSKILTFLYDNYMTNLLVLDSKSLSEVSESNETMSNEARSYNSVLDGSEIKNGKMSVQFNDRDEDSEYYDKVKGKCRKLAVSRHKTLSPHCQSAKYLRPVRTSGKDVQDRKILQSHIRDIAVKKRKDFLARAEKIIQDKKNMELLKNWRTNYKTRQLLIRQDRPTDPISYPYDTCEEYMTFLTREDIEKDLPDKYRKKIVRKSKPTVPRKSSNDVHLAMKIKKLFENLEAIDLDKRDMTPRTEQRVLLNEIQKISEIKQKLTELSLSNAKSVSD
ncbi:uncharacterized protein LOC119837917, partial [Zerene cesonia]|uniref:uncharacterized protein LOC119837917 n=1 Tax=Zerene cesonia TaxID=33412 RepID=UPI0018E4E526